MTTEPVVDVATEVLLGKADRPLDILTAEEVFLVEPDIFIDTEARTPLEIAFAFGTRRHILRYQPCCCRRLTCWLQLPLPLRLQ